MKNRSPIALGLGILIPIWGLGIIASRLSRLATHPPLIDIVALLISLALAIVALYEAFRGRKKRAVWLFAIEACLQLFILTTVDLPWARGDGGRAASALAIRVDAWTQDLKGDHVSAAWDRVQAADGGSMMTYSNEQPARLVQEHACGIFRAGYDRWIKSEPALHASFSRQLGACAAADGNTELSIAEYAYHQGPDLSSPSIVLAATFAATDGYPTIAAIAIKQALTTQEHARACRSIDSAYDDRRKPSQLSLAIRAARLARCT